MQRTCKSTNFAHEELLSTHTQGTKCRETLSDDLKFASVAFATPLGRKVWLPNCTLFKSDVIIGSYLNEKTVAHGRRTCQYDWHQHGQEGHLSWVLCSENFAALEKHCQWDRCRITSAKLSDQQSKNELASTRVPAHAGQHKPLFDKPTEAHNWSWHGGQPLAQR